MSRDSAAVPSSKAQVLPANASDARAWKSVPLCSEQLGLRCPPDKIGFQT